MFAKGIVVLPGSYASGNIFKVAVSVVNVNIRVVLMYPKEKARICKAKSAFVRSYPAKPERAEHTGRIRHWRIGCDYKKISQKV